MTNEVIHQRQLPPHANKFHKGNGDDGKHYWLTPPDLYAELNAEFHFDFDPCPYPLPNGFDGLTCEWGQSNYVNPPFGSIIHEGRKKGPTAWVRKAIEEKAKRKRVVFVYPVDKWVLMMLAAIRTKVRNLGAVRWLAIEDGSQGKGTERHIACFILEPEPKICRFCGAPAVVVGANNEGLCEHWLDCGNVEEAFDEGVRVSHCSPSLDPLQLGVRSVDYCSVKQLFWLRDIKDRYL